MRRVRARGADVRRFILEKLQRHPTNIGRVAAEHFGITRQAVNKHLDRLLKENAIIQTGRTRGRAYGLAALLQWRGAFEISAGMAEDVVWRDPIAKVLGELPDNVLTIWNYGFTEMFNNALDHSRGTWIHVGIKKTAVTTEMALLDDGIGIFRKIQTALNLLDERHAVLELAKGKLTTDPSRHSGEGIFFSSRVFDEFDIRSGGVSFSHQFRDDWDWTGRRDAAASPGTFVWMKLSNHTARTLGKIFDQYTSGDDYGFSKTTVPVKLARYGHENLISRSQAKRLLARVELFKVVILDFHEVPSIGQAFADEIFRVFQVTHPEIQLAPIHANPQVKRMIARARSNAAAPPQSDRQSSKEPRRRS